MKAYKEVVDLALSLGLKGIKDNMDGTINDAESKKYSYLSFLRELLLQEVKDRSKRKLHRNLTAAHFPSEKRFESFNTNKVKGISKSDISGLLDCAWIDKNENVLLFGPLGVGKTHIAIALGFHAIESGYTVCFERVTNLMNLLKNSHIQQNANFRIKKILKADLIIIDEIGYTPIDKKEANLFFNLVSEVYEKASIILTSNKSFNDWAEMLGDEIMTTALLDRLLHHAKIFNLQGESFRLSQNK